MRALLFSVMLLAGPGCSTVQKSDSAVLQGSWRATEIGGKGEVCRIVISGEIAEFHGADPNQWFKAAFRILPDTDPRQVIFVTTESSYPPDAGSTRYAIYRVEDGLIRLTATEPGNPNMPSAFDAPDTRQFELRKK